MAIKKGADYTYYLYTCNRCSACVFVNDGEDVICPGYAHFGLFSHTGGGKLYMAQGILDGRVKPDREFGRTAFECMACGSCEASCPAGIEILPVIKALREEAIERGVAPQEILDVPSRKTAYKIPARIAKELSKLASNGSADVLVFWGCSAFDSKRSTESALHFARLLTGSGVKWTFSHEEICCGSLFESLGFTSHAKKLKMEHALKVSSGSHRRIIYFAPECFASAIFNSYMEKEAVFYADFIMELFDEGRLKVADRDALYTHHDPCALTRGAEVEEGVLHYLHHAGLNAVSPSLSGKKTFCCGGGFGPEYVNGEFVKGTRKRRLSQLVETGASTAVTACPRCLTSLSSSRSRGLKVLDISEIFQAGV